MAAFPARERDAFMTHWRTKVLGKPANNTKTIMDDGEVAGYVVSWLQDDKRLVGYWIARDHWGKGVATRALSDFLDHDRTRPLYAWVAEHNVGSIRVLEKCGFARRREEGSHLGCEDGVGELLFCFEDR